MISFNLFLILILKNGADPNQTESEHHLTPIHVLCDAEYHGQSLRVSLVIKSIKLFIFYYSKKIELI
jgi:hypothetical protein